MAAERSLQIFIAPSIDMHGGGLFIAQPRWRHTRRCHNIYVLILVKSGVLRIQEEETEFTVGPGQALLLFPHRTHWGISDESSNLTYFWMHFQIRPGPQRNEDVAAAFRHSSESSGVMADQERILVSLPQHARVLRPERMETLFRLYLSESKKTSHATLFDQQIGAMILMEVLQNNEAQSDVNTCLQTDILANRAAAYLHANFVRPITTSKIAEALECNPKSLSRAYHRLYGVTLTEAIHRTRVQYAEYCLLNQDRNITEIAQASGFPNASYFIHIFRRHKGMTPAEYRRLLGRYWVDSI